MRCCWAEEISPLPLVFTEEAPPACGAGECGKTGCPRRERTPAARPGDLDGLLTGLAPEPPDPDELTARVLAGLRAAGALPEKLAEMGEGR